MKFSTAARNTVTLLNGVSSPNLISTETIPFGLRFALMILSCAILPFEYVATSFVVANLTVVVKRVTLSTYHVDDPSGDVSDFGLDVAILSPISYGLRTKIRRRPSK